MKSRARIIWQSIGITLAAVLLIAAAVCGYKMAPTGGPCRSLEYIISDRDDRMYLSEEELTQLLRANDLWPVGQVLTPPMLHRIERTVAHHPMVRTAECYLTPRNEMRVRITQRRPLLRVKTPFETYFIDSDRKVMEAREKVRDKVLIVSGNVGVRMASEQLTDFALWLQENDYWNTRIHHLQVQNPQKVYVYLRGENMPRVMMGAMRGYERKLAKLQIFLERSGEAVRGKQYSELDVRFRGQVIGR